MNYAGLNEADLRLAVHLGDFVDELVESFDAVMPIWERLRMSKCQVLGNHVFSPRQGRKNFAGSIWADRGPVLDCREW